MPCSADRALGVAHVGFMGNKQKSDLSDACGASDDSKMLIS